MSGKIEYRRRCFLKVISLGCWFLRNLHLVGGWLLPIKQQNFKTPRIFFLVRQDAPQIHYEFVARIAGAELTHFL